MTESFSRYISFGNMLPEFNCFYKTYLRNDEL